MIEPFFGLDIGSHTLKAVQLKRTGDSFYFQASGQISTPVAPLSESDIDLEELSKKIKELMRESKISTNRVVIAFPESSIFTRVIEMPQMSEKELETAMKWEAEQFIPVPLKDVKIDYNILKKPSEGKDEKMPVFLVAVPLATIDRYLKIMKLSGLQPIAFETEIVALVRSLAGEKPETPTTLIINVGAQTTDLCIVSKGCISFTRSIPSGGTALARAISQELGFDMRQAEEYKKAYGLLQNQLEGKIQEILKPIFDVIVSEIERALLFYQTHYSSDLIKRVMLSGGTAKLPGVIVYLADTLDLEIQLGNPWETIKLPSKDFMKQLEEDATSFGVAVGLAMRGF